MHAFNAMNTTFTTLGLPLKVRAKAESWIARVEHNLSRFLPDNELASLNRSAGRLFMASALLFQVLTVADRYFKETDGLFHPFLGKVLAELGYASSFEKLADRPAAIRDYMARKGEIAVQSSPMQLNPGMMSVTVQPPFSVDLGGIAKGWSASQLAGMLRKEGVGSGAIDAGGDIALWGGQGDSLEIGIADPFQPDSDLLTIRVRGTAGIATSSTLKRQWLDASGTVLNHIVDPRSGRPGASDLVQVTVLAPDVTGAEVYAKCLLLLGSEAGGPWLEAKHPDYAYIGVRRDRSVVYGSALTHYCPDGVMNDERAERTS